jgi:chorismate dehydratase
MSLYKAAAVSYLNTKPLIYGFKQGQLQEQLTLSFDYPSLVARQLLSNQVDIGLVPVAMIPRLQESFIISNYCIGCTGPVASVCLFSDVPIEQVTSVLLDYQSRTSVQLAKILLKEYWKINPVLVDGKEDFRDHITGTTAGLVIGDRAFQQRKVSAYSYDLGTAWLQHTGLPFVFATWVSNKLLPASFTNAFNTTTAMGLQHLPAIAAEQQYPLYDLYQYYTQNISYQLDAEKRKGMNLFLKKIKEYGW